MNNILVSLFAQDFMIRALLIGLAIGLGAALLSPFLVLNGKSMISDGLSHIAYTGVIFGLLAFPNWPLYIALPITIAASILITYLSELKMMENDAAIGVVSAFALSIGLIVISVARGGFNSDIETLLTGSILASNNVDVIIAFVVLVLVIAFVAVLYRQLLSSSYDPTYAKFSKVKGRLYNYILSGLTATFIVLGVRTVGMLLISSFVIFPSLIASQISRSFKQNIFIGGGVSLVVVTIGVILSYYLDIPTGSSIVVMYSIALLGSIVARRLLKIT